MKPPRKEIRSHETDLSTKQDQKSQNPWVPEENVDETGETGGQSTACKGKKTPDRMKGPLKA